MDKPEAPIKSVMKKTKRKISVKQMAVLKKGQAALAIWREKIKDCKCKVRGTCLKKDS